MSDPFQFGTDDPAPKAKAQREPKGSPLLLWLLAGIALILLAGLGIGGYFVWRNVEKEREREQVEDRNKSDISRLEALRKEITILQLQMDADALPLANKDPENIKYTNKIISLQADEMLELLDKKSTRKISEYEYQQLSDALSNKHKDANESRRAFEIRMAKLKHPSLEPARAKLWKTAEEYNSLALRRSELGYKKINPFD